MYQHPDTHFEIAAGRPSTSTASSSSSSLLAAAIKDSSRSFTGKQRNPHPRYLAKLAVPQIWQQKKKAAAQEETLLLGSTSHWTMYSCLDSRPADSGNGGLDIVGVESFLLKKDNNFLAEIGGKGAIFNNGKTGFERRPPPSLKVQMVDDTVLIEPDSTVFPKRASNTTMNWKRTQNHRGAYHQDANKKTNKMPRLREGEGSRPEAGNGAVIKKYSREQMEGMRFVNGGEQRKIWTSVYTGLGARVAEEYENLTSCCDSQRNAVGPRFEPKQSLGGTPVVVAPRLLGSADARGRYAYVH